MTLDELLTEAKAIDGWYLNDHGLLRCADGGHCPVVAVARKRFPGKYLTNIMWGEAGEMLRLPKSLTARVVMASDGSDGYKSDLRRTILDSLGVEV